MGRRFYVTLQIVIESIQFVLRAEKLLDHRMTQIPNIGDPRHDISGEEGAQNRHFHAFEPFQVPNLAVLASCCPPYRRHPTEENRPVISARRHRLLHTIWMCYANNESVPRRADWPLDLLSGGPSIDVVIQCAVSGASL
jgi:hypothetical protein